MTLETSKKILKIFGIIGIIIGILGIIGGLVALAGGGAVASAGTSDDEIGLGVVAIVAGVFVLISGIVSLLEGIFSVRAAKDSSKIMPAWVFAIIGLVSGAISFITNIRNGASSVVGAIISLAISVLVFIAANTIKKSNQ